MALQRSEVLRNWEYAGTPDQPRLTNRKTGETFGLDEGRARIKSELSESAPRDGRRIGDATALRALGTDYLQKGSEGAVLGNSPRLLVQPSSEGPGVSGLDRIPYSKPSPEDTKETLLEMRRWLR